MRNGEAHLYGPAVDLLGCVQIEQGAQEATEPAPDTTYNVWMDTQTRHEDEILKLRQDVRELKALNRRSAWFAVFAYPVFALLMMAYFQRPDNEGVTIKDGAVDVSTSLAQNRLIMDTSGSRLEVSNMGKPIVVLSDMADWFALAIEDGKLIATTERQDGTTVTNVLVDRNLPIK